MSALWFNPIVAPKDATGAWVINSPVTWPATNPVADATDNFNRTSRFMPSCSLASARRAGYLRR